MKTHVNTISGRLSLRPPQRDSLEILARITEIIGLGEDKNLAADLAVIQSASPSILVPLPHIGYRTDLCKRIVSTFGPLPPARGTAA